jgi:SAM-dependent methyltransferase
MTSRSIDFYGSHYKRFASDAAAEIRREVYGVDLGQTGWRGKEEQARIAAAIRERGAADVLDVACGSGGPSIALVEATGCRIAGVDIEPAGVDQARRLAAARGLEPKARFETADCNKALPFEAESFDLVICIDAILHLADRYAALADWSRLLRPGGAVIFADAAVLTGPVSRDEIDIRAAIGPMVVVPPGVNEAAVAAAGLLLRNCDNTTTAIASIAAALRVARECHSAELRESEGEDWFETRQLFLETTAALAASGRLSRFFYVAEKPLR